MSEVEDTQLTIKECLKKLDESSSYLRSRLSDVQSTEDSVQSSIAAAKQEVENKFQVIQEEVIKALDVRRHTLLSAISDVANKDLETLKNLESRINEDINKVQSLVEKGNGFLEEEDATLVSEGQNLKNELECSPTKYAKSLTEKFAEEDFKDPDLPCVSHTLSVTFEDAQQQALLDAIHIIGDISMTGSLQIVDLHEQPGAILVRWDDESSSECESITDYSGVQEYVLQVCRTDNKGDSDGIFSTVYSGEDTAHAVGDLEPHISYTFRVCGRFGNEGRWSSWSFPRSGITTLHPHEWSPDDCVNKNKLTVYQLSNNRKTATKVFPDSSKVLRSRTMSYQLGTPLVFKIGEFGDSSNGDGIGLTTASFDFSNTKQVLQCPGSVSVNSKGVVYVNGLQMTMKLPPFRKGTVVTFGIERVSAEKLRVSITVDDKQVTFDWHVTDKGDRFYFAMGYQHSGWQVTV